MRSGIGARLRAIIAPTPVSRVGGAIALGIAAAALAAWTAKAAGVGSTDFWIYRMNPMTAACLALSGAALWLPRRTLPAATAVVRTVLGCIIAAVGMVKLWELANGQAAGIDLVLFPQEVRATARALMAPNTAIAFALLGGSIAFAAVRRRRAAPTSQILAALALAVATAGLIAYAYGAIELVAFTGPSTMALHSAVGLAAAAVGALWIRPRRAVSALLTDRTFGGITARRLLPMIVVITVGLGGIRVVMARQGLLDEVNGIATLVAAVLVTLTAAVLVLARRLRDISRRLAARERMLKRIASELEASRDAAAASAAARADFIANVSHEIRNPVSSILAYAARVKRRADLDPAARMEAGLVDSAARALLAVVNDVLDVSMIEAGRITIRPAPADPAAVVAEAARLLEPQAAAKNLELEVVLRPGLPARVSIDPDRLRQILLNLIGNAIKFTDTGSVQVIASYDAAASRLCVEVADTGPGVSAEQRALLFRRFSQVSASPPGLKGAGLGLSICKGLVEAMNGEIGVDGRPGGGSVFHVCLPVATADGEASAA